MRLVAIALALAAMIAMFTSCEELGWGTPTETPPPGVEFTLIDLSDAVGVGLVEADITGNGASTGDSIEAVFVLVGNEALEISVPRGMILVPGGSEQRMVVTSLKGIVAGAGSYVPVSFIRLWPGQEQQDTYLFEAYCLDFNRDNPSSSTGFTITGSASTDVIAVLRCGDESGSGLGAIQSAVWALTDDVTQSELQARFEVSQSDLEEARRLLECAGVNPGSVSLFTSG